MKTKIIFYFIALLLGSFNNIYAQNTEAEYLKLEQKRLEQAQKVEAEIEEFIQLNKDSYELTDEIKKQILTSKSCSEKIPFSKTIQETLTKEELNNVFNEYKKQELRKLFFEENKDKEQFFKTTSNKRFISCINGGFEEGIFDYNFEVFNLNNTNIGNVWNGLLTALPDPIGVGFTPVGINQFNADASLVSQMNEPFLNSLGTLVPTVLNGNNAIKLGGNPPAGVTPISTQNIAWNIVSMNKNVIVDDEFIDINFSLIMHNPNHFPHNVVVGGNNVQVTENNFFRVRVIDLEGNIVDEIFIESNPNNCLFNRIINQNRIILFTDWVCARLNVSNVLHQEVTIEFMIADCYQSGHFSTVYIDDICGSNSSCTNPQFGSINLDPLNGGCPSFPLNVCGTYQLPPNSTLGTMELEILQGTTVVGTVAATSTITTTTFCFQVNATDFPSLSGQYEFRVNADFLIDCPATDFNWNVSDTSTNIGPDIDFNIPLVTPTFTQEAPICEGSSLSPLPTISNNGITGNWSPAVNNMGTTTYTFTPNNQSQCATTTTMTIVVNPSVIPTFNPIAPICSGATLALLPTTSLNGVEGSWSPALNNTSTTTYTFTPNIAGCYSNNQLTIVVEQCVGDCIQNLSLTTEPHSEYTYNVSSTIEVSGNYQVDSGKTINMYAGQSILLKPLTHIKSGSNYLAKIKGCGDIVFPPRKSFAYGEFCFNSFSQTSTASIFDQITMGGVPANYHDFILSSTNLPTGVTLNQNGTITIAPSLAVNSYSFSVQICEVANPLSCTSFDTVTFNVAPQIIANLDNISVLLESSNVSLCALGTLNLLWNDSVCQTNSVNSSNVTVTLDSNSSSYFSVNGGDLVIAPNTPSGIYQLTYTICLIGTSTCSTSTISLNVHRKLDAENDQVTFNTKGILCCGNSSLTLESFENTIGPGALPSMDWNLSTGIWKVFDNGVGLGQRWGINNAIVTPPLVYYGTNAAYINRENIGVSNTSEDYLATPKFIVPANGQLRFHARTFSNGNTGTLYKVKAALAISGAQNSPATYTTLLAEYTEDQLTVDTDGVQNPFNIYTEKVIDFPASMVGQEVYVAFIMVFTQPTATISGDRWLLDNVRVIPKNEICEYNVLSNDSRTFCGINQVVTETDLSQVSDNTAIISSYSVNPPSSNVILNTSNGNIYVNSGATAGTYTITYTICESGFCDTASVIVNVVDKCTSAIKKGTNESINKESLQNNVNIYPNPSKDIFYINLEKEVKGKINISVYNLLGQKIIDKEIFNKEEYQIDLSVYSEGSYLVKIKTEDNLYTKRIIKN